MSRRIGYLGPAGTFSEEAAARRAKSGGETMPCSSLEAVFAGLAGGRLDEGVIPVENSIEGGVGAALDLLATSEDLSITGEILLPVEQALLALPGSGIRQIRQVLSHPQALAQCRGYLNSVLPGAETLETSSTAEAARLVAASDGSRAAVGPIRAAALYGLKVLATGINDCRENVTRFLVVSGETDPAVSPGMAKTSIVIWIADRPGALHDILREFTLAGLNLTRIESRPAKKRLGDYLFFIDFIGHRSDPVVQRALDNITRQSLRLKVLGSFTAAGREGGAASGPVHTLAGLRADIDAVDDQLVDLLARRAVLADRIGSLKQAPRKIRDLSREEQLLARVRQMSEERGVDPELVVEIYRLVIGYSVARQEQVLAGGK
ncbi:MAG: prephenate dehydratase [Bacillota bacterium]|jgi:prephenate dehydratase